MNLRVGVWKGKDHSWKENEANGITGMKVSKKEIIILFSEKFRHNMLEIIEKGIFGIDVIDVLNSVKFYNL